MRSRRHDDTETALANFALTLAKALLVCCVMLFVFIAEDKPKAEAGLKPDAELVVTAEWPREAGADVDTWLRTPTGGLVWFHHREDGVAFLDRDDMGHDCASHCEEIVSIRGVQPAGEYVLNLHLYNVLGHVQGDVLAKPVPVTVKIVRLNPTVQILWEGTVLLDTVWQEQHVTRFSVSPEGVGEFSAARAVSLVEERLQ